jgi:hypothetical protein
MLVVRYVALAALAVWLGGTVAALAGDIGRYLDAAAYACGGVMLVGLFVMKFVGPPPHAFVIRVALVVAMLAATALARRIGVNALPFNAAIGFVLLFWYTRE